MAFLGWRPAADEGQFSPIPESVYTAPHEAAVVAYEDPKGRCSHFEPVITDSVWPATRTRASTRASSSPVGRSPPPAGARPIEWDFGDGQTAAGPEAEHVYLALGNYPVTLTAQHRRRDCQRQLAAAGLRDRACHRPVQGGPADGLREAGGEVRPAQARRRGPSRSWPICSPRAKSPPTPWRSARSSSALRVGEAADAGAEVRRLMADCASALGQGRLDEAIANYQASLVKEMPPAEKLDVLARLIRLLGIERKLPEKAVPSSPRSRRRSRASRSTRRRAGRLPAGGDRRRRRAALAPASRTAARELYRKAEATGGQFIPPQVRAARIGSYPNSLREYIGTGNYGAALDLVERWDETSRPTSRTARPSSGAASSWPCAASTTKRPATWSGPCRPASGAGFETEARWLLAEALEQLGQTRRRRSANWRSSSPRAASDEFTRRPASNCRRKSSRSNSAGVERMSPPASPMGVCFAMLIDRCRIAATAAARPAQAERDPPSPRQAAAQDQDAQEPDPQRRLRGGRRLAGTGWQTSMA